MSQNRNKILYLITKGNWGGAQRYVFDLAASLSKDKLDVAVAFGEGEVLEKKLLENGVRTIRLKYSQRNIYPQKDIALFFELLRLYKREKPDIVHLNSSKIGFLGALAARLVGIKRIVFTAHGWPFKEDRFLAFKYIMYIATWLTVILSHCTIVVSREDKVLGKRMRLAKNKIFYIPNAIKPFELFSRETAEKTLFAEPSVNLHIINSIRLVTIAELTKNKGLRYGIEMMKELEKRSPGKYTYTIFGEGEEKVNLQNQSEMLLNPQNRSVVQFANITTNISHNLSTNASLYLQAFDIFILPSIKEGMSYVILEAASAGLPIVATEAVRELAGSTPNMYIVPPKSGLALADKVEKITKNLTKSPHHEAGLFEKMLNQTLVVYKG